jgi:hypothetical protein
MAQMTGPGSPGYQSPTLHSPSMPQQPAASTPPPSQSRGHGGIVGIAREVRQSSEQSGGVSGQQGSQQTTQVLRFRLELYDQSGNRTQVKSVEMRGLSIVGFISDGDHVEVFGKLEGGLIRTKQIVNLTTGANVKTEGYSTFYKVIAGFVIFCIVGALSFGAYAFISYAVLHQDPFKPTSNSSAPTTSPDEVLNTYCTSLQVHDFQTAYDQYSSGLKSRVSSAQLSQTWSDKPLECTHNSVQVSGNQATTTLSIYEPIAKQTDTFHVTLVLDGSNGWVIDSIQPQ